MLERLGRYTIEEPIGSGGMGQVYRAHDSELNRFVAIKVLKTTRAASDVAHERFEREAKAVAALVHAHICPVYDFGNQDGVGFLVMPYLEGETLAWRLLRGPLPIAEVLKYGSELAEAIAVAHRRGVIHRDLKPSNVMLTEAGAVLLDFGLAKIFAADEVALQRGESTVSADLTHPGTLLGTVRYMSPEALERQATDTRSDIFSLGAVLYEMVAGKRAFGAESEAAAIAAILKSDPPPLRDLRPDVSPELESLIAACLAKKPADRRQSAADIAQQLKAMTGNNGGARPRWAVAAALIGTLSFATSGDVYLRGAATNIAAAPPPHLVALPCEANDAATRAQCNGFAEALIARMVRLTQTHDLQVTPQLGGFAGTARTVRDARRTVGATRVLQLSAADNQQLTLTLTLTGDRAGTLPALTVSPAGDGVFDGEERAISWLVRILALELTPVERESLMFRGTQQPSARHAYLEGRGHLAGAREPSQFDAAIAAFKIAIETDQNYAPAHAGLGMAWRLKYLRSGDATAEADARNACTQSVRLQPNLAQGHNCLGMLHSGDRAFEPAAGEFARAVQADPTDDDAVVWLGRVQEELHLSAEAERTYRAAIDARPRYYNPRLWMANFYRRQARYADAARALEDVIALIPDHARMKANVAMPLNYLGRYEEAAAMLKKAIAAEPTAEAHVALAMTHFRMRRFEQAAQTIELARQFGVPDATTLGSMARIYYWWGTLDARAKATALYQEALGLVEQQLANPAGRLPKAELHISAADFCAKLGRTDAARRHLSEVGLNVDDPARPTDPHQLFFAALVYAQLVDSTTAVKWLERAVFWGVPSAELRAWPELDALRSDRTFQSLTRAD